MRLINADELLKKLPREELVSRLIVAGMPTINPPMGYKVLADGRGWAYYGKEEAEPVRRGKWVIEPGIGCKCTVCGFDIGNDLDFMEYVKYCPACGAKNGE